jgi:hypothetical protein
MVRARLIAMAVRNAMEDFHVEHLDDYQMAVLNPIIRNAIATALHAMDHYHTERPARAYLQFQGSLLPAYWEEPELLEEYAELWPFYADRPDDGYERECRHCGRAIVDPGGEGRWTHHGADGQLVRGCRAASFKPEEGWDESLRRSWVAAPK